MFPSKMDRVCTSRDRTQMLQGNDGHDSGEPESAIPCFRCGICCSKYQARLSLAEAKRIVRRLGIGWAEFLENYADSRWPGTNSFLLRQVDGACIFLQGVPATNQLQCRIHSFKPSSCRKWNSGLSKKECREGLGKYWELVVGPSGQIEGTEERLRDFYSFLETLTTS